MKEANGAIMIHSGIPSMYHISVFHSPPLQQDHQFSPVIEFQGCSTSAFFTVVLLGEITKYHPPLNSINAIHHRFSLLSSLTKSPIIVHRGIP
jgi:hypothetical protein